MDDAVNVFADYLDKLGDAGQRARTREVLVWVGKRFPALEPRIAWNQPMFMDHGTFIMGFSVANKHLAVAPEKAAIDRFSARIVDAGYRHTKNLVQIPWAADVDFQLLAEMIEFNIDDKAGCTSFWRA